MNNEGRQDEVKAHFKSRFAKVRPDKSLLADVAGQIAMLEKEAARSPQARFAGPERFGLWACFGISAAVLLCVLWSHTKGQKERFTVLPNNAHMCGPEKVLAELLDLKGCRYVGLVGETGIIEVKQGEKTWQTEIRVGMNIGGCRVKSLQHSHVELLSAQGEKIHLKLKGDLIVVKDGVEDKPDGVDNAEIKTFTISGRLLDENANPVPNTMVLVMKQGASATSVLSDEKGNYKVVANTPVSNLSFLHKNCRVSEKGFWDKDAVVDLNLKLKKPFQVDVLVLDPDQKPVEGAGIVTQKGWMLGSSVKTDSNGKAILLCLEPLKWMQVKSISETRTLSGEWEGDCGESREIQLVLSECEHEALVIIVKDENGKPASGAEITGFGSIGGHATSQFSGTMGKTNEEGKLVLATIEYRLNSVSVTFNGMQALRKGPWKKSGVLEIDFSKSQWFSLEGRVLDFSGQPVKGCIVRGMLGEEQKCFSFTDEKGCWSFKSETPIENLICRHEAVEIKKDAGWKSDAQDLIFDFSKEKVFLIKGQVQDLGKRPAIGLQVFFGASHDTQIRSFSSQTITDSQGNYQMRCNVPIIEVFTQYRDNRIVRKEVIRSSQTIDFLFWAEGFQKWEGKILGEDGSPMVGAHIYFQHAETGSVVTTVDTGKDGAFEVYLRPKEPVYLKISGRDFYFVKDWIWKQDEKVLVDMSRETFLTFKGLCKEASGKKAVFGDNHLVSFKFKEDQSWAAAYIKDDGGFTFKTNRIPVSLEIKGWDWKGKAQGPWKKGDFINVLVERND